MSILAFAVYLESVHGLQPYINHGTSFVTGETSGVLRKEGRWEDPEV